MDDTQKQKDGVQANNAAQPQQEGQAQPAAQPAPQEPAQQQSATPAPESDRTREQFEKLLESNRQLNESNQKLREEMQQREAANQQFAPVQLPPVQQQQPIPQIDMADFVEVDPYTGEKVINEQKLNAKIEELGNRASRAEEAVQKYIDTSEQREIERQNKEAFNAYPELNPADPKHNVVFHNQTRAVIYDSVLNPQDYGGQPLSFVDAAKYVKEHTSSAGSTTANGEGETQTPEQQAAQEQQQAAQELKQQAAASPAGQNQTERASNADPEQLQRLQLRTRLGDAQALAERLANTDHLKPKAEEAS